MHLVSHAFAKGCLFLVAGAIVYRTGIREIRELRYLSVKMPWTAATFTVAAFSMIGIPPTSGFFSKLYLILGAIDAEQWLFVAVILVSSMLALMYFVNVVRYIYFPPEDAAAGGAGREGSERPARDEAPLTMVVPMVILAVATVLLGLFNGEVVSRFLDPAVAASIGR